MGDNVSDAIWNGRRFRMFNVIDDFSRKGDKNREVLRIEIDTSLTASRVVRAFEELI